ncbi:phenylacetic acid degradation bifunctional protein PaaZ [Egicoccus halophilus]|uniref:Bifunctional aldehyde dehydrogenase/enoyl-CoA hydratase n=1 Tax=Egicoccus halophilus TaxID=1670830 RepID=A0A8J3ABA8_9ACTN|nr:phenylacetic acid degradation bifunctional protein PaaZ [Egicoccus halophilus]GGI09475.1 bifunctional aldehyde dehydrogenase/enoyl-CoA hydratase [Egicoccus halophilus]
MATDAPPALQSYVVGEWVTPEGDGEPVPNALTGEVLAVSTAAGIDMGAVVRHAREVGGPALRALTFHERAAKLKELVGVIAAHKDELYALSAQTGATPKDAWVDVDGGIGVLATYASKVRRELPNAHVAVDGPPEHLSKDGSFLGQHVWTPRHGVAVQINAYNFPCWGSLEKLAPALAAGMPVIVKPAPQTAQVAEALYRHVIASGVFPEGAIQFVAGHPGDLFDHLDGRDVVGFTGSAATAEVLRGHRAFTARSATFVTETDSLNASVLLPSAATDDAHVQRFVKEIARELTTKAGQRCTAIRRALVPEAAVDAVVEGLRERLAKVTIGDPTDERVRMGALVSASQKQDVERTIEKLLAGCRKVVGDDEPELIGDVAPDAFLAPTVLLLEDRGFDAVHELEPFGPVATLIPYTDADEAVALVQRGGGSLVTSVFGDASDPDAATLFTGIASHHGRLLFVDDVSADTQTGHGTPLPHLVHGGPGRAGGGEEMGGVRGMHHFLQRTALTGSPELITRLTGRYAPGAPRHLDVDHPFTLTYDELRIGDALETDEREITLDDIEAFAALSGDTFYAHMDEEAAKASPIFEGRVAHGYFLVSAAAGLFVKPEPGPVLANFGLENLRFLTPVYPGDRIKLFLTCKDKVTRREPDQGTVTWDVEVLNQDGDVVAAYDVLTIVRREVSS